MSCQLPTECLNEIFEYLEEDKITLHSCLLVNRLWCKISVRILWRFKYFEYYFDDDDDDDDDNRLLRVEKAILSTLIACLPNESIILLYKNKIFIPTPTPKSPLFNYVAFFKVLRISDIGRMIVNFFENEQSIQSTLKDRNCLVLKEIFKMFMNQISSLNKLIYYDFYNNYNLNNVSYIDFSEARDRLADLSKLCCSSNIHSEFFYQLSQICHNLQSLSIRFENEISNGLKELISSQNNLKNLNLFVYADDDFVYADDDLTNIIVPALTKHSNTLRKLHIYGDNYNLQLSFIALFLNLQEIRLLIDEGMIEDFKKLQNVTFPKLEILKISRPQPEYMEKFLENNGKYLKEFHIDKNHHDSLGLSIAKFCPNLRKVSIEFIEFNNNELDILKTIFNSCQYLESIKIRCGKEYLKKVLESVAKHSPENFCELKICNLPDSEDLELFFISWKNRAVKKSITLIIMIKGDLNEKIIKKYEKYKNLGIIKKLEIKGFFEDDDKEVREDRF